MLDVVAKLFTRRDPLREAQNCLSRIMSRYDMTRLSYNQGIVEDRRENPERHLAVGVWLFPVVPGQPKVRFEISRGVPAVTHDVRTEGLGVMTPMQLKNEKFVVATPDDESMWRFFECEVRHNTRKPGGWYMIGMHVDALIHPEPDQMQEFHDHVSGICDP